MNLYGHTQVTRTAAVLVTAIAGLVAHVRAEDAPDRLEKIKGYVAARRDAYEQIKDELNELVRVDMTLDQELLLPGERFKVQLGVRADRMPQRRIEILQDCFGEEVATHTFELDWHKDAELRDRYVAEFSWLPPACGNYLVHWVCDTGGDLPEFWRNFSVIDRDWAVLIVHSNANGNNPPEKQFHELHIPSTMFSGFPLYADLVTAPQFASISRDARQYGDGYLISLWQSNTYVEDEKQDENAIALYAETPEARRVILGGYRDLLAMCRFGPSQDQIMCSAMSNDVMRSLREAGFNIAGGLYADQNWADAGGRVQINHWGMPSRPFFMSRQDFRKEGDGGADAMVGIAQCHRHSILCRDYNCVFSLEPGSDYMMDRYQGIHRERKITPMTYAREMGLLESIAAGADLTDDPLFFTCCFEFAGFDWMPEMYRIHELFAKELAHRFATRKLAPATNAAVAKFYRSHYTETPESVVYLPDVWAGRVRTGYDRPRPAAHPDTLEIENGTFKAMFRRGEVLPYAYYDYTTDWDYPHWDQSGAPRNSGGYVIPDTDDRFRILPPILDTRGFQLNMTSREVAGATEITIEIRSSKTQKDIALTVWDIPRTFTHDRSRYELEGGKRLVPVRAPLTDNLNAIIVTDFTPGLNRIALRVTSAQREPRATDLRLAGNVLAKVVEDAAGKPLAFLYSIGQEPETIRLNLPAGMTAMLYPYVGAGDEPVEISGETEIRIVPKEYRNLSGLTFDELRKACPGARPIQVTVDSPEWQQATPK